MYAHEHTFSVFRVREATLKVDHNLANFSRANDTFLWRILSFQSSFEENEIWIICKATCFKQKAEAATIGVL